jgi:DNA mismatch repair ATPase MutL
VTDVVTRLILSHPNIAFTYLINDKVVFETYGDGIDDAITSVYGNSFIDECFKKADIITCISSDYPLIP